MQCAFAAIDYRRIHRQDLLRMRTVLARLDRTVCDHNIAGTQTARQRADDAGRDHQFGFGQRRQRLACDGAGAFHSNSGRDECDLAAL